jgi:hypothetical protein
VGDVDAARAEFACHAQGEIDLPLRVVGGRLVARV